MLEANNINIEQALKQQGEIAVCTSGISMYPMLRSRKDMVLITTVNKPLEKDDVVLYRAKSGKLILHRIIKITSGYFVIRGDNTYKKEFVKIGDVFGMLKGFYRNGKYYDCSNDLKYKLYVFFIKLIFPIRYLFFGILRPFLSKIKHFLLKDKK